MATSRHTSLRFGNRQRSRYSFIACGIVPCLYTLLGLLALPLQGYEVFPFFSWFLFPVTPNVVTRWGLVVRHVNGRVPQVTWFEDDGALGAKRHSIEAQVLIQELGQAVVRGDTQRVRLLRARLEANFLTPELRSVVLPGKHNRSVSMSAPCGYSLWQRSYDPLLEWQTREPAPQTASSYSFECGQP